MSPSDGLIEGQDGNLRCWWHGNEPAYQIYHDTEWGIPCRDDQQLFEKISLEGFQAGLSWWTILQRREGFRAAFHDFDLLKVKDMGQGDVERLLQDTGIIRHRGKIEATINNAARALEMIDTFGSLANFFDNYVPGADQRPAVMTKQALIDMGTPQSAADCSKQLKKLGWKFVGPTTIYAFMQAAGFVDDHMKGCWAKK